MYRIVFPSEWNVCLVPGYKQPYLKVCYRSAIHLILLFISGKDKKIHSIDKQYSRDASRYKPYVYFIFPFLYYIMRADESSKKIAFLFFLPSYEISLLTIPC